MMVAKPAPVTALVEPEAVAAVPEAAEVVVLLVLVLVAAMAEVVQAEVAESAVTAELAPVPVVVGAKGYLTVVSWLCHNPNKPCQSISSSSHNCHRM